MGAPVSIGNDAKTITSRPCPQERFWSGRSVLVTGHTGFKGSWLCRWLAALGAQVHGISLEPSTDPTMFEVAHVADVLASDRRVDVRNFAHLNRAVAAVAPEVAFHLAAQPLVRQSYADPMGTFGSNVLGTVHVLEALRRVDCVRSAVVVTTDKVYADTRSSHAYAESDQLGGHDPYASSKAMTEAVVDTYRRLPESVTSRKWTIPTATARAGNVVGGGDWSPDRLVPDCIRAFSKGEPVTLRYPHAVRPWQHVLEPLLGYVLLAESLAGPRGGDYAQAWNFGPMDDSERSVAEVARAVATEWGEGARVVEDVRVGDLHETDVLRLDSRRAAERLAWTARWGFEETLHRTVTWYRTWAAGEDLASFTDGQIEEYCR